MGSNTHWKKEDIPLDVQERMIIGEITGKKKRSKYNAQKTKIDGFIFSSKKESEYYKKFLFSFLSNYTLPEHL